jgi:hypothetical protein
MKVFVSSSWRNRHQPAVVHALQQAGYEVYDFRNPGPDAAGFSWAELDPDWLNWTAAQFRQLLNHPRVEAGFSLDMDALRECDALVMLQPAGRSAALELGWAAGAGKPTIVLLADGEPELMLKMADRFCLTVEEVISALAEVFAGR